MKRMLINNAHPEEVRVAFIDGQELYDLDIESRTKEHRLEDVYKATVDKVLPNLSAVFVDYGRPKFGFLSLKHNKTSPADDEANNNPATPLKEGQEILVQVTKDERDNKGAQLTTDISLKSQHLTLHPCNPNPSTRFSGYSHASNRQLLAEAKKELSIPKGMGVTLKSESIQTTAKGLQKEIDWLLQIWQKIIQANESKDYPSPRLLYQRESSPTRVLRDYLATPVDEIVVDTPETFADFSELIDWCLPEYQGKLKLHEGPYSLFRKYGVDHQVEQGLDRIIKLKSGGTIVIDPAEALTAIDVNSARDKGGILKTNIEAVDEIARQLKIRDISGLIVVDLIGSSDIESQDDVENIYKRMEKNLFYDRAVTRIEKISRFGLLEIERQRLRASLADTIATICPHCQGRGSVANIEHAALQVIYDITNNSIKESVRKIIVNISPEITSYIFNNKRSKISCIEKENNVTINIISNPGIQNNYFELKGLDKDDIIVFKLNNRKLKQPLPSVKNKNKNPVVSSYKKPKVGFFSKLFSILFISNYKPLAKKHSIRNNNKINSNNSNNIQQKRRSENKYDQKKQRPDTKKKKQQNKPKNKKQPPKQPISYEQKETADKANPTKKPDASKQQQPDAPPGTLAEQPYKADEVSNGEHASVSVASNTSKNSDSVKSLPKANHQQKPEPPQVISNPPDKPKAPMPNTSDNQVEVLANRPMVPNASEHKPEILANKLKALNDPRARDKSTFDA